MTFSPVNRLNTCRRDNLLNRRLKAGPAEKCGLYSLDFVICRSAWMLLRYLRNGRRIGQHPWNDQLQPELDIFIALFFMVLFLAI